MVAVYHRAFARSRAGPLFFQPLQFHLESPDLFKSLCFTLRDGLSLLGRILAKDRRSLGQPLLFPAADLMGMQIIIAGDFIDCLHSLSRFQGNFELELIAMMSTFFGHLNSSTGYWDCLSIHLSLWFSFWGHYRT